MFCVKCGTEIPESGRFCPKCGTAVEADEGLLGGQPASSVPDPSPEQQGADNVSSQQDAAPATLSGEDGSVASAESAEAAQTPRVAEPPQGLNSKRKRTIVVASIATAVVVAAVAIGVFAFLQNKAYEDAHKTSLVTLVFKLPEYGSDAGTGVPVEVVGKDLDGNEVSQSFVAPAAGGEIELKRGDYQARVAGSPVTGSGCIYRFPSQQVGVAVSEDGVKAEGGAASPTFNFEPIPKQEVTDEQVQAVKDWMSRFGFEQPEVDRVSTQVTDARQAEINRIAEEQRKAEEEARRKAEEEARQRAAALAAEAFSAFPRTFTFSSGVGGWSSGIDVAKDGTFTGKWSDSDMGVTGPGYPGGTVRVCDFAGSFTPIEKVSNTDYLLQIDYLRPTQPAGVSIENGRRIERSDDQPYGLGSMTETPVSGWHLYCPGQSTVSFSDETMMWLYPGGKKYRESTLSMYALVNENLKFAWFSKK